MANDGTEVRLGPGASFYVAPTGTTAPTDATTSLNAAFVQLGYLSEDGATISPNVDTAPIMALQSVFPVAYGLNEATFELNLTFLQTNRDTTKQYFLGQSWTMGASGKASLSLSTPTIAQLTVAIVLEYTDSAGEATRYYVPRAISTDRQEIQLSKSDPLMYGITYAAMDSSGSMGTIFTNNTDIYSS